MSQYTVRAADPGDAPAIGRIAERTWQAAYGDSLSTESIERAMANWYDEAGTRRSITQEDIGYFVAEREETIIGYVSGSGDDDADRGLLGAIYVRPDWWNEGVGTALLDAFEEFCLDHGYRELQFHVLAANDTGKSFYRKHGYESVETEQTELFGEEVSQHVFRGPIEG